MNACKARRKLIVEMALDALEPAEERTLRAHLESCAGCREYLAQISDVSARLRLSRKDSNLEATEAFHQRVMRAVRGVGNEERAVRWPFSWRISVPVAGVLVAALVIVLTLVLRPPSRAPAPGQVQASLSVEPTLPPSVANYRIAANRSLDQLDELLTRQANRRGPEAPVFTASVLGANGKLSD